MRKWKQQVKINNNIFSVIEHTDKECNKARKDGKILAPVSHGFVCLYRDNVYEKWCGTSYAKEHLISNINYMKKSKLAIYKSYHYPTGSEVYTCFKPKKKDWLKLLPDITEEDFRIEDMELTKVTFTIGNF